MRFERYSTLLYIAALTMLSCSDGEKSPLNSAEVSAEAVGDDGFTPVDLVADWRSSDRLSPGDASDGSDSREPIDLKTEDAGPQPPPYGTYSGGVCPTLVAGKNSFTSMKLKRTLQLYLPPEPAGAAVVIIWHGLGDTATNMAAFFRAEDVASKQGAIVVVPNECCKDGLDSCCDSLMVWGLGSFSSKADITLFDDLLACLDSQFDIDNRRVYLTGFSAGSLFSTYLLTVRGEYVAAAAIFSGGIGDVVKYKTPVQKMPVLASWGGTKDLFGGGVVNFDTMMKALVAALTGDGHFVVQCDHGKGHTIPFDGPLWTVEFLLAHSWGDTVSPYRGRPLPPTFPSYCF